MVCASVITNQNGHICGVCFTYADGTTEEIAGPAREKGYQLTYNECPINPGEQLVGVIVECCSPEVRLRVGFTLMKFP